MESFTWLGYQVEEIAQPLGVAQANGRAIIRDGPELAFFAKDRRAGRGGRRLAGSLAGNPRRSCCLDAIDPALARAASTIDRDGGIELRVGLGAVSRRE